MYDFITFSINGYYLPENLSGKLGIEGFSYHMLLHYLKRLMKIFSKKQLIWLIMPIDGAVKNTVVADVVVPPTEILDQVSETVEDVVQPDEPPTPGASPAQVPKQGLNFFHHQNQHHHHLQLLSQHQLPLNPNHFNLIKHHLLLNNHHNLLNRSNNHNNNPDLNDG